MCVIAIDFETSGYSPESACALGMARIEDGAVRSTWYRLIRPPDPKVFFTDIHGLTWPMLKNQPTFAELWPDISDFIQGAELFAAHNASFDRSVLHSCCKAAGVTAPAAPFACTLRGSRRAFHLPHYRLNDVCKYLGVELDHHQALSDALGAAAIYLYLRQKGISDEDMKLTNRTCSTR